MYRCCTDPETGERFGWGRVLDYIGVEWEEDRRKVVVERGQIEGQMRMEDYCEIK